MKASHFFPGVVGAAATQGMAKAATPTVSCAPLGMGTGENHLNQIGRGE